MDLGCDARMGAVGKGGILQICFMCLQVVSLTPLGKLSEPAVFPVRKAWHSRTQNSESQVTGWANFSHTALPELLFLFFYTPHPTPTPQWDEFVCFLLF